MDKSELLDILTDIGLTDKEANIYLVLLELKEAIPSTVARVADVKRPTTYVILEQLQKKGLVSHCRQDGKYLYYQALPPKLLLEKEYNRYTKLEKALPLLRNLHQKFSSQPQMSLYEGKDGMISLLEDSLTAKSEILCMADADNMAATYRNYESVYLKKRLGRKIKMKCVYPYSQESLNRKKHQSDEITEVYLAAEKLFPIENKILVYDDKIAICAINDHVGVIIQNASMADSQRVVFNLCFQYAKLAEPKLLSEADKKYLAK